MVIDDIIRGTELSRTAGSALCLSIPNYVGLADGMSIARVWTCRYSKRRPRRGGHFEYRHVRTPRSRRAVGDGRDGARCSRLWARARAVMDDIIRDTGLSRTVVSALYLAATTLSACTLPLSGRAIDRLGTCMP